MKLTWEIPPALQPSPDPVASRELGLFTRRRLILVKSWQWTPPTSHWIWSMRIILFDVCLLALILIFCKLSSLHRIFTSRKLAAGSETTPSRALASAWRCVGQFTTCIAWESRCRETQLVKDGNSQRCTHLRYTHQKLSGSVLIFHVGLKTSPANYCKTCSKLALQVRK